MWQALLSYDRPQDLHQAIGILYSLFHLDIDNLTLSLLNVTLPNLLLQSFPAASPTLASGSGRASALSSGRFLSDPRGGALAKLCVLCINLMCAARRFTSSAGLNLFKIIGSRPSDHYFRSVCLSVCLFVCAEFFSAVFDPIWIKLGHMLHVRV